jgi:hypothetical protein
LQVKQFMHIIPAWTRERTVKADTIFPQRVPQKLDNYKSVTRLKKTLFPNNKYFHTLPMYILINVINNFRVVIDLVFMSGRVSCLCVCGGVVVCAPSFLAVIKKGKM